MDPIAGKMMDIKINSLKSLIALFIVMALLPLHGAFSREQGNVTFQKKRYEWDGIEYLINHLQELIPKEPQEYCSDRSTSSFYLLEETPSELYAAKFKEQFKTKFKGVCDINTACRVAEAVCMDVSDSRYCTLSPYATFSIERMKEAPIVLFERMQFTENFFNKFLNNPDNVNRCCKNSEICEKKFKKVKLKITMDNQKEKLEEHAFHKPDIRGQSVYISDEFILSCKNKACIEKYVIHEIGHVCQSARGSFVRKIFSPSKRKSIDDMEAVLGKETTACIKNALDNHSKNTEGKHNLKRWYMEALAESIYFNQWEPMHLPLACDSFQDKLHSNVLEYLPCLFDQNKEKFCPEP